MSLTPAPAAEVSPTGKPTLPQTVVKVAAAVVGAAALALPFLPPHTIAFQVCTAIIGFGALIGIASPGTRKKA